MNFFTAIYLAIAFSSSALAVPRPAGSRLSTRRMHILERGLELEAYHPESNFEVPFFFGSIFVSPGSYGP